MASSTMDTYRSPESRVRKDRQGSYCVLEMVIACAEESLKLVLMDM